MASQYPPKRGTAFTYGFQLFKNDGTIIGNPSTWTKLISKDGGYPEATVNTVTEVSATYGFCSLTLTATEMTADRVQLYLTATNSGCVPHSACIYTASYTLNDLYAHIPAAAPTTTALSASVWAYSSRALTASAFLTAAYDAAKTAAPTTTAVSASVWAYATRALTASVDLKAAYDAAKTAAPTTTAVSASVWAYGTRALTASAFLTTAYDAAKSAAPAGAAMTLTASYDAAKTAASQTSVTAIDDLLDTEMPALTVAVAAIKTVVDNILRWFTNRRTVTTSAQVLYDDAGTTAIYTQALSKDDTTVTRGAAT